MISGWVAALSVSGLAVAGLDRWTKSLAIAELPEGEFRRVLWRSGFRRVQNVRVGLVTVSPGQAIAAWLVCVASLLLLLRYLPDLPVAAATGLGAVVGGASANLFDRLRHGSVTDFIVVGRWPTFNLADAGMVVGCLLAAWSAR